MKKVLHALQRLEKWIIVIAFVIMVVAIFCQVVNRNIFKIPVSGFEEAAKYSMAYMVLLGTELGLHDGTQIAIKGVVDKLKGKVKKVHLPDHCGRVCRDHDQGELRHGAQAGGDRPDLSGSRHPDVRSVFFAGARLRPDRRGAGR